MTKPIYVLISITSHEDKEVLGVYSDKARALKDIQRIHDNSLEKNSPFWGDELALIEFKTINRAYLNAALVHQGNVVTTCELEDPWYY